MPIRYNKNRKTFEQEDYKFELQNVRKPSLFRDIYPYDKVPKITFNYRLVPMDPPDEIWITDTTFRDGQQGFQPFRVKDIVNLYKLLHKLGGKIGLIRQSEFFLYSDKDKEAVNKCRELNYKYPEITGWIRAKKEDFKLVKEMKLKETGILTSCSDYHIFLKLRLNRKKALEKYKYIVEAALNEGIIPRCHFEDITRADLYGFVIPFAIELKKLSERYKMPVKIRMCDTLGLGVIHPGASVPRSVHGIIYGLKHYADIPPKWLEWHGHNDFYRAVPNATAAWLYGCSAVNGTLLGIGERTGNTPIEALAIEYVEIRGDEEKINLATITEVVNYFKNELHYSIPHNQPFVGENFNKTFAGIHADGLLKNLEIYTIFNTKKILKREVTVGINDKSGLASIAFWVNQNLKLKKKISKNNTGIKKMKEWIDRQYAKGRVVGITDEEMFELVKKFLPQYAKKI